MSTLTPIQEEYRKRLTEYSDIKEHLSVLWQFASMCKRVTEFGVRSGNSTTAFLAAQPDVLTSYDKGDCYIEPLKFMKGRTDFRFIQKDTLEVEIEETDFLFIDDYHSGPHVFAELEKHAHKVKRYIGFHDIVYFGVKGEQGEVGILGGINDFLVGHPEWKVLLYRVNCCGLMIIRRTENDTLIELE